MKNGDLLELSITGLAAGGRGLARDSRGRAVFVWGALAGERVIARVEAVRKSYLEARVAEALEQSPHRAAPACGLYGQCGGCDFMHLEYQKQAEAKAQWVEQALKRLGPMPAVEQIASPLALGWRCRVRLQTSPDGLGFFARRSHKVIPVKNCPVASGPVNQALAGLWSNAETLRALGVEWVEVMAGLKGACFLFMGLRQGGPGLGRAGRLMELGKASGAGGVRLALGKRPQPWQYSEGSGVLSYQGQGLRLMGFPGHFMQANLAANDLLVERVVDEAGLGRGGAALDLYSGVGNFSLALAARGWRVTAVEGAEGSGRAGGLQLGLNQMAGEVEFRRAEVGRELARLGRMGKRFDLVVLDPPRAGAKGLMPAVAGLKPNKVVYISCHPAALARDAGELMRLGFKPASIAMVDMFPQTGHVEAVMALKKGGA